MLNPAEQQLPMERTVQRPLSILERILSLGLLSGDLYAAWYLLGTIHLGDDSGHTYAFLGLGLLAGLALYLLWLLLALSTVSYRLEDGTLFLRRGLRRIVIPLGDGQDLHLYRWRARWSWSGGVQKDLGVGEVALFPPLWIWKPSATYVLVYRTARGDKRAVAFRPSPSFLAELKAWIREIKGVAD